MTEVIAVEFDELRSFTVELSSGDYLIDGEIVSIKGFGKHLVQVTDADNICAVRTTTYTCGYISPDGHEMSVERYDVEREELSDGLFDEDGEFISGDIDAEYKYKKFIRKWKPLFSTKQVFSEPLKTVKVESKLSSDNPFVVSAFASGSVGLKDASLWIYNRPKAVQAIVSEKFKSLGFVFKEDAHYSSTEGEKVWGNSTHSGIRYVVAFGRYIFSDEWNIKGQPKGSLDKCISMFNSDKKVLEGIIQRGYNRHFRSVGVDALDKEKVFLLIKSISSSLGRIQSKVKTEGSKRDCARSVAKLESYFYKLLEESDETSEL